MSHCHNHATCTHTALAEAEKLCAERGLRLTDIRRKVLSIVWQSHKAVTAAQVMQIVGPSQPPVTYRALEFLTKAGLIHHVSSINAYVGCPHPQHQHQSQLLICDSCQTITEITSTPLHQEIARLATQHHFTPAHQIIEIHGTCANCHPA